MAYTRTFGQIPGHPEGSTYRTREELRMAGLHAHNQAGISGTPRDGADAIVLNGGYPDDHDEGDLIIYTGQGGQNGRKEQIADQRYEKGNAGLVLSQYEGFPVRVIRGHEEESLHAPLTGYRYDGLYRVVRHWFKKRADGYRVLQFRMVKIGSMYDIQDLGDLESDEYSDSSTTGPVSRIESVVARLARKASVVRNIKDWYENRCQICREAIQLPTGPASQVAHIQGLGVPHNGPDHESNALCLCPNDHLRFDYGAIYLTDDLKVVEAATGTVMCHLYVDRRHAIGLDYVRQHRSYWSQE
ncbi:HNH endonuclease [Nonomuraea sp. 3-1Str]|uniref:YDG/SRA domain-containing protein n=1 Tax=Nonomuraea sp. 3-1Str TaxID=2929801 RepID=UPI002856D567|nr:YDG/SRA domain-containing protein [Nonomuraea sp. 3-1Str]MDR8414117.1 HNH endonuclease [Nonomuraea sp. 3-1Str]